jgi:hypothetical protein
MKDVLKAVNRKIRQLEKDIFWLLRIKPYGSTGTRRAVSGHKKTLRQMKHYRKNLTR